MSELGWWITQVSTLLVAAMGAGILRLRPRTPSGDALAGLLLSYGLGALAFNLASSVDDGPLVVVLAGLTTLLYVGLILAAARLVQNFPRPLQRDQRRVLVVFAISVAATAAALIQFFLPGDSFADPSLSDLIVYGMFVVGVPGMVAVFAVAVGLARRYRQLSPTAEDDAARRQMVLMAAGLIIPSVFNIAINFLSPGVGLGAVLGVLVLGSGMGAWLWAARVERGGREAMTIAWLIGLVALAAMAARAADFDADRTGAFGVARVFAFAILAYALLHAQLLGIDVKLRFAISKSTLAALFIAVFFVASEGAQLLFGAGDAWVGLLASGALVFALAPLQRAADRLAERAVPVAVPRVETRMASSAGSVAYKAALRAAMRDGVVTRREERHLAEVAVALGINPVQAHEWRDEVEAEAADRRSG